MKNCVEITGTFTNDFVLDHIYKDEKFYRNTILTKRESGYLDKIPVIISEYLINPNDPWQNCHVTIKGSYRSYNLYGKLLLNVFADYIDLDTSKDTDQITLDGYVCKAPVHRFTPNGKEITDLLLANNRNFGKTDYIPCIVWGSVARKTHSLEVGTHVKLNGRIQSRPYTKDNLILTAYEVSASDLAIV